MVSVSSTTSCKYPAQTTSSEQPARSRVSVSTIIISAVMPIVPGVLITNAIQDLFSGHMLMFTTKSLEALVTAFGIGAGVGTILIIS